MLYEPAVIAVSTPGWVDRMEDLLAQDRREEVVVALMIELAGLTPEHVEGLTADPSWPGRVGYARGRG